MNAEVIGNYVKEIHPAEQHDKKIHIAVKGFVELFPFLRVSLFAYSPLSFIGEGIIRMDESGSYGMSDIREDVRGIPPVYSVVHSKKATFVNNVREANSFPDKYVKRFNLSSLIIVPVIQSSTVVGAIFLDRYTGTGPLTKELITSLEQYGKCLGQLLYEPSEKKVILSKRETEVLQELAFGYSIKEIAGSFGISPFTVRDYVGSALRKLNVKHRGQGIAEAIRLGLIH
ncbi:LuxR C-terminal-related transcriptional regulator [Halobacillus shinanisalinarum]|uniref:LuxR C-terminal-related transcriptional regulator n=1 Tax=Halobacillus shinanisalinarum TaxID=2932258 RepID=A0ABY4H345_9BACI|nr:LuxR C-terminal-related transcriptional regulator [Halobacillus shinanisalinarum]UOQ94611.1 LuxR C-terminal-related transcriptional regulator [Halobacillus shinanisalinarum]